MASTTGINLISNTGFSPRFTWQVGINSNDTSLISNMRFRATIRPLTYIEEYTRVPSREVLYEETGIILNNNTNMGSWTFPLATNAAISGGPYRDYEVVIEAHDTDGNTSAGNVVGQTGEIGWANYPNGYDFLTINNPRPTGVELSFGMTTESYLGSGFVKHVGQYKTFQRMDSDGDVYIEFTSGILDSRLAGGYIYVSSGQFPKYETQLRSGVWGQQVVRTRFDFNTTEKKIYAQNAAWNIKHLPYGYVSVSFYDTLDAELIANGYPVSGLYLSDNAIIEKDRFNNGDALINVGMVTGLATSITDPVIVNNIAPGVHVLGYTTGENYTNIV